MVAGKQKETEKGPGKDTALKDTLLVTYILQLDHISRKYHHLLIRLSNYESINELIH
jgi:hypothetical protein